MANASKSKQATARKKELENLKTKYQEASGKAFLVLQGHPSQWTETSWKNFKDFNPLNLKRSVGAGVRIFLPMLGLLGVDYGYGFDRNNYDNKKGGHNCHIVIGQEF